MANMLRLTLTAAMTMLLALSSVLADNHDSEKQEEANKAVMRWIFENGVNAHNPEAWDSVLTDDYVRHCEAMPPGSREIRGIEAMKDFLKETFAAMPDWHEEVVHLLADGDRVALMTRGSGTMTGSLGGIPGNGKRAEITSIMIMRFQDGKIAETWITWDNMYFMEQLGLLPPPETQQDTSKE